MNLEFDGATFNSSEYKLRKKEKELKAQRFEVQALHQTLITKEEEIKKLKQDLYMERMRCGRLEAKMRKEAPPES